MLLTLLRRYFYDSKDFEYIIIENEEKDQNNKNEINCK